MRMMRLQIVGSLGTTERFAKVLRLRSGRRRGALRTTEGSGGMIDKKEGEELE